MNRWSPAAGQLPAEREPWRDPSLVLGSTGPTRVATDPDADPDYEPPRIRSFTHIVWSDRATGEVIAVAELGEPQQSAPDPDAPRCQHCGRVVDLILDPDAWLRGCEATGRRTSCAPGREPLLWQDEADQA